jgi:hypothetical protein
MQEALRQEAADRSQAAHTPANPRREAVEPGADHERVVVCAPLGRNSHRNECAQGQTAKSHRPVRRRDPAHFLDGGVQTTAVGRNEIRHENLAIAGKRPDLRLPGARAGSDAVKKNQRRHWINLGSA